MSSETIYSVNLYCCQNVTGKERVWSFVLLRHVDVMFFIMLYNFYAVKLLSLCQFLLLHNIVFPVSSNILCHVIFLLLCQQTFIITSRNLLSLSYEGFLMVMYFYRYIIKKIIIMLY